MCGRAVRRLAAVVLPLLVAQEARGQFLRDLHHIINPGGLTASLTGKSPEELAQAAGQALKDHAAAAAATPAEIADKLKEVFSNASLTAEAAESLRDAAQRHAANALEGMSVHADVNISGAKNRQAVVDMMQAASSALQQGAGAVANASGALQDAGSNGLGQSGLKAPWEAFQGAPEQLAKSLLDASPKVADALNKTSLELADALRQKTPQAAALLNKTGHEVAGALSNPTAAPGAPAGKGKKAKKHLTVSDDASAEDQEKAALPASGGIGPLTGVLLLALAGSAIFLVAKRYTGTRQRSPMLLSDALDTVHSSPPARAPRLQPAAQEPLFTQF